jgi:catechol 2,3-dioxygenase-like lactoylglutathione lyase family enzyme
MLRGLTSLQLFVDDVPAAERWYAELLGIEPYFRSEDAGLPPGHVGFRVGDYLASSVSPTASSRPMGSGPARQAPSRTGGRRLDLKVSTTGLECGYRSG